MKKLIVGILGAGALMVLPSVARAGIAGTAHDLSGANYGTDQICIFCHTPHNAKSPQLAPLWNHASTVATYTLYQSTTLNAVPGQPAGTSKACLSCHDGTVAVDSYGSTTGTDLITGDANVGTDLRNDHPISFPYNAALVTADGGGLNTPDSASWVDVAKTVPLYAASLECASCHNVHSDANSPFLRVANTGSALCLKCHNK